MQSTPGIKNIMSKFENSEQSLGNVSKHNLKKEDEKQELLKLNLKHVSAGKNQNHNNTPKFLKQKLKSAIERREEHEDIERNMCTTGNTEKPYITKPISSNKPTFSIKSNNLKKPITEGKGEGECSKKTNVYNNSSIVNNKFSRDHLQIINKSNFKVNQDHTDQSTTISRDGKNSTKFNVAFFENIMKENESTIKINKSNKPSRLTTPIVIISNFTTANKVLPESPNETVTCIDSHDTPLMDEIDGPTEKAIYDDVTEVILNETFSLSENQKSKKLSNIETSNPNSVVTEDVYNDVHHSTQNLNHVLSNTKNQSIVEGYVHDDVSFSVNVKNQEMMDNSPTLLKLPTSLEKPNKSFLALNKDQFIIPLGLEKWLQAALAEKKHRLKNVVNGIPQQVPTVIRSSKPTSRRSFKGEEQRKMTGLLMKDL